MKRRLTLLLLLLCSCFALHAQDPDFAVISELPDDFAELDTLPAPQRYHSLHMVGFRYSYDLCNIASMPTVGEHILLCPVNFSVMFTYYHPMWDQLNVFGLQFGAKYGTMGYNSDYADWGEAIKYVEFPLGSQMKIDFSHYRALINVGTYYAYKLSTDKAGGFDEYDIRHDYGVYAGGGFAIVFGRFELQFEGNYKFSFCSLYHPNKYSDLYWITAYPRNLSVSAGLFVHLW